MEMEPALFCDSLQLVDLRRLRFCSSGHTRSAIAYRAVHSEREKPRPLRHGHLVALQLDLSALAPGRFVLTAALRFKASSSDFDGMRHWPRGKSPSRRFPIRVRTSRFTS